MTASHYLTFELSDVRALRMQCGRCRAALSVAIDQTINVPEVCPNCGHPWAHPLDPGDHEATRAFVDALKALLRRQREQKPGFALTLEFPDARG